MTVRVLGALLALSAHLLLVVTVWFLLPFLRGDHEPGPSAAGAWWWAPDLLLVLQFSALHSLLLWRPVRARLERWLPRPLHGCLFCAVTCLCLLSLIALWQTSPVVLYRLEGAPAASVQTAYLFSWVGLVYSLSLTGFGNQTGWTPFWAWLRGRGARRRFEVRGAYRWLRHPVYLCFLGQVWLTPVLSLDRALLNVLFTAYIFLGSYWKDRRLVFYLGDAYRHYQARVPGYPLVGLGPLGRVPLAPPGVTAGARP